jgi:hypothetical protein
MEKREVDLVELDEELKKEINSEFDGFIKNRMLIDKLRKENEVIQENLANDAGYTKPVASISTNEHKIQKDINHFHKNIYDMRTVLYQIEPELKERIEFMNGKKQTIVFPTEPHDTPHISKAAGHFRSDKPSINSLPSHSNLGGNSPKAVKPRKSSNYEHEEDKASVDTTRSTKMIEVDVILKYFQHDTELIQDMVIGSLRQMDEDYQDKR